MTSLLILAMDHAIAVQREIETERISSTDYDIVGGLGFDVVAEPTTAVAQ